MIKTPTYYESPHKIAGVNATEPVLLALSGGADSTSLLYNLVEESRSAGFEVFAAHVNHNIRLDGYGNEAERDEKFCRELCGRLGVKLFVKSVDIPALAESVGESVELTARRVRYEFFSEVMDSEGISLLVTAHNATDNFETQLFNLCRGSGISGLAGIPRLRELDGNKRIVRPILSGTKAEILEFCSENSIPFVTDSTNFELDATRNRIRNIILPELEAIFPAAQRAASRLAASASQTAELLKNEAQKFFDNNASFAQDKIAFSCESFNSLHISLRCVVAARVAESFGISLEHTHIDAIVSLIERAAPHSRADLPRGLVCGIEDGCAVFSTARDCEDFDGYEVRLDGVTELENAGFCVVIGNDGAPRLDGKAYALYAQATLRSNKIRDGLLSGRGIARSRREGDRMIDGGNTKRIKKLMCDKKLPLNIRNTIPLVCLDGEIIYVPMCAICDNAKMNGEGEIQIFIYKKL